MVFHVIDNLAKDYSRKIFFGKLNMDEYLNVARQYGIKCIPTILMFKGGRLVNQIIGTVSRQVLEQRITLYM